MAMGSTFCTEIGMGDRSLYFNLPKWGEIFCIYWIFNYGQFPNCHEDNNIGTTSAML